MVSPYRKAVAAAVGVVVLLLAQVFHVTVDDSLADALVNGVVAVLTVVAVFKARNAPAPQAQRLRDPIL